MADEMRILVEKRTEELEKGVRIDSGAGRPLSRRQTVYNDQGFNPGLYTQFVGGNKASLEGANEYRLEASATLPFGASTDSSRSCVKTIAADPPRRRDGVR